MLCSGALLAQQSTVIEKVIREDNGVLMFEELLDVPNGCQGIIECLNYLHGANFDFNVKTLPVIFKFSCFFFFFFCQWALTLPPRFGGEATSALWLTFHGAPPDCRKVTGPGWARGSPGWFFRRT